MERVNAVNSVLSVHSRTQSEGSRSVGSGTRSIPQSDSETSLEALMSELQLHNRTPSPAHRGWGRGRDSRLGKGGRSSRVALAATSLQGRKVIARSTIDGFFYPGKQGLRLLLYQLGYQGEPSTANSQKCTSSSIRP